MEGECWRWARIEEMVGRDGRAGGIDRGVEGFGNGVRDGEGEGRGGRRNERSVLDIEGRKPRMTRSWFHRKERRLDKVDVS